MLLAVGLIDIAVMVYCIINSISYSSSLNIFAVVAGIFLLRGSLRAVGIVRWFAVFMASAAIGILVVLPFIQPLDLILTYVRLSPIAALGTVALLLGVLCFLLWLQWQLGKPPVLAAQAAAGRKQQNMRIPVAVGAVFVCLLVILLNVVLRGEHASKGVEIAQQELGRGYQYHVSSLQTFNGPEGTLVSGVVTAWNANEIRHLPVKWKE